MDLSPGFINPNISSFSSQPSFEQVSSSVVDKKANLLNQVTQLDATSTFRKVLDWLKQPLVSALLAGALVFVLWFLFDPNITKEKDENGDYGKQNILLVLAISTGCALLVYFIPTMFK